MSRQCSMYCSAFVRHLFRKIGIDLAPGMRLDGPVHYERGTGCTGTTELRCNMTFLSPMTGTSLRLSVKLTRPGEQKLTTTVVASGQKLTHGGSYTVQVA